MTDKRITIKLAQIEEARITASTIYIILGGYGDKLPDDIEKELRIWAESESKNAEKLTKKLKDSLWQLNGKS